MNHIKHLFFLFLIELIIFGNKAVHIEYIIETFQSLPYLSKHYKLYIYIFKKTKIRSKRIKFN